MNHTITLGDLLLTCGTAVGLLFAAFGLLVVMAAGMSDADTGDDGDWGCGLMLAGIGLVTACLAGWLL